LAHDPDAHNPDAHNDKITTKLVIS